MARLLHSSFSLLILFSCQKCSPLNTESKLQKRSIRSNWDTHLNRLDNFMRDDKYRPKREVQECASLRGQPLDVIILLDGSGSITDASFKIASHFTSALASTIKRLENTRVGIIRFSRQPLTVLDLGNNLSPEDSQYHNEQATNKRGNFPPIDLALAKAIDLFFSSEPNARKVLLTVTDGQYPSDWVKAEQAGYLLSQSKVEMFVVGVGRNTEESVMDLLSGYDSTRQFLTDKWQKLDSVLTYFIKIVCQINEGPQKLTEEIEESISQPFGCKAPVAVMILLDSTASIGKDQYGKGGEFVKRLAASLSSFKGSLTGVLQYSEEVQNLVMMNETLAPEEVSQKISEAERMKGVSSRPELALEEARRWLKEYAGERRKVIVTVTDAFGDNGNNKKEMENAMGDLQVDEVSMWVVFIGSAASVRDLSVFYGMRKSRQFTLDVWENVETVVRNSSVIICGLTSPRILKSHNGVLSPMYISYIS